MTEARTTHSALAEIASKRDAYPNGLDRSKNTGMKMKAIASNVTVLVYPVPVDFRLESNMATSPIVVVA